MSNIPARIADWIFGYDFFLSYSHADGKIYPRRLKQRLEQAGFKIFLDQTEYVAGADLRRETRRQVQKSQKLVVIGREAALKSEWVKREVDVFVDRGRVPIVININKSLERSLPGATLADMAREQHWLRLEETLVETDDAPTDYAVSELIRSFGATRQEKRRQQMLASTAGVFAVLAASAGYLAWLSEQRRGEADARLATTLETATRFVNQTVRASDKFGVPRQFVLELLREPERVFLDLSKSGTDTPEVREKLARTLLDFSDNYEVLGDSAQRLARAREARAILDELVRQRPRHKDLKHALAVANSKIGTALLFQGDTEGAADAYLESLKLRKGLAGENPNDRAAQRAYSVALNRMGEHYLTIGDYDLSRNYILQARTLRQNLSKSFPDDRELRRDLFVCQIWLGDTYKAERKFQEAREAYVVAREVADELASKYPSSNLAARDLTVSLNKIGETYLGEGNVTEARKLYETALALREKLAASDPPNRTWQRDLFVSYIQLGNAAMLARELEPAQPLFRKALQIAEALSALDPKYAQWEADVAEARGWLGLTMELGGTDMVRDAITRLEAMNRAGRLPADRKNLIDEFSMAVAKSDQKR